MELWVEEGIYVRNIWWSVDLIKIQLWGAVGEQDIKDKALIWMETMVVL